jgi:ribosomal protein S18 acetylase RimI-like enzyme
LYEYFFPDAAERPDKLLNIFSMLLRYAVLHGEVYANSATMEGVSVWLPSDKVAMSLWQIFRFGGISAMLKMSRAEIARSFGYMDYAATIHERFAQSRHRYLQFIGVDPDYQGKGHGGRLFKFLLNRLDSEQESCFLETQNLENLAFYLHHGFQVVERGTIPGTDIGHWAMLR